jgi:hypothetical protein
VSQNNPTIYLFDNLNKNSRLLHAPAHSNQLSTTAKRSKFLKNDNSREAGARRWPSSPTLQARRLWDSLWGERPAALQLAAAQSAAGRV